MRCAGRAGVGRWMARSEELQLPLTFAVEMSRRRRENARLYAKIIELRQAGCVVYRASERQVQVTIADRTRLLTHGELLGLVLA